MRALVVDDSRAIRRIVARTLDDLGFGIDEAGDGQQALDLLTANRGLRLPELACVDWNMPVHHGQAAPVVVEVCRLVPAPAPTLCAPGTQGWATP